eukprot:1175398-Prorocentrum_minimum.AAC.1
MHLLALLPRSVTASRASRSWVSHRVSLLRVDVLLLPGYPLPCWAEERGAAREAELRSRITFACELLHRAGGGEGEKIWRACEGLEGVAPLMEALKALPSHLLPGDMEDRSYNWNLVQH